ncbi:MAG: DUF1501 domain-containing protein [Rhodoferax sp.]|nr:DUF1501 domain-containing protein [Rhodoferax sp.]
MTTTNARRQFLRAATALAASPGMPGLSMSLAALTALAAQTSQAADVSGPYKAIVCLFMHGGCDTHNWVVPTDPTGYAQYAAARSELAWPLQKLQPILVAGQAAGRTFGMPEELAPLRKWYESGQAAVVANVGPLVRPVTRAEYLAGVGLPSKLFSHNDQASTWQSLQPEGAPSGWGGRMGDILMSANAYPVFTSVSLNGNAVFLSGSSVTQYQMGADGPVQIAGLTGSAVYGASAAPAALRRQLAAGGSHPLQAEYTRVLQRSIGTTSVLQAALAGVSVPAIPGTVLSNATGGTALDKTSLARQLRMVAQLVGAGPGLGMRRQVFMVSMGGFDTHANQMRDQPAHMAQVAHSIDYFMTALATMGLLNNVTLFTASDFGRTLLSNGDGSDHGWGSHHFVLGGAVQGRNIHGRFPITSLGTSDDVGSGRLLPAYAVSQVAAPLGRWLGLSAGEVATVLPGLANFDAQALRFI